MTAAHPARPRTAIRIPRQGCKGISSVGQSMTTRRFLAGGKASRSDRAQRGSPLATGQGSTYAHRVAGRGDPAPISEEGPGSGAEPQDHPAVTMTAAERSTKTLMINLTAITCIMPMRGGSVPISHIE